MTKAQWVLVVTFATSMYGVGNIWMTQFGWRLWPFVGPNEFGAYHNAWWAMIKPVVFPMAGIAVLGSIALIWCRPAGVTATPVWLSLSCHIATYTLTILMWGRWQAQMQLARHADGSLDPLYVRAMGTHWIRAVLITMNGLAVLWMMAEHLATRAGALQ